MSAPSRIRTAMMLAAGLGKRMRPLTLARPKPLIEVAGQALIDHVFARLRAHGARKAVVNHHWLGEQIIAWAARQTPPPDILLSDESARVLETGGGLKKALPLLGEEPFFVLNTDSFWLEKNRPALARLEAFWDEGKMDCLVLTVPLARAVGYDGRGDFALDGRGRVRRAIGEPGAQAFTGVYVVHPRLFAHAPEGAFSMNVLFDLAMTQGRMYGLSHEGLWLHVGTPAAIAGAEAAMAGWNPRNGA